MKKAILGQIQLTDCATASTVLVKGQLYKVVEALWVLELYSFSKFKYY